MKTLRLATLLILASAAIALSAQSVPSVAQLPSGAQSLTQLLGPNVQSPWITCVTNALTCSYTAGIVYSPNGPATINPGSLTLTANATTCARSSSGGFTSCDFIYYSGSGTALSTTQTVATAAANGNSILAYVTTNASGILTLVTPYMDTSAPVALSFAPVNPTNISNFNSALQSQVVVSATEYYITNSNLNMPAVYTTPIGAGTALHWRLALAKTAAGTGTFQLLLKKGTNGSTADSTLATITIGTQTAAADNMEVDVTITFTSATAGYYSVIPRQSAATGTGFGLAYPAVAAQFNGTFSGQTTTTASDKYGISFVATTGTPTITVAEVMAVAFGVS